MIATFIDNRLFPLLTRYMAWRWHIVAILSVMLLLMYPGNPIALVLIINSYLNSMSVAVSSVLLGQQRSAHDEALDRHDQTHAKIDALHAHIVSADTAQTASKEERP